MNYNNIINRIICTNTILTKIYRNYAFKSDLKIKWVRPEKLPFTSRERSGDLAPVQKIDQSQLALEYRNSKELETASDIVRRLFTLEFSPAWKTKQVYIKEMTEKVRRHDLDKGSAEAKIARMTGSIRALQEIVQNYPHNKKLKVKLKELIEKRQKHLRFLRQWDYKRFEWVLENLDIIYKPHPPVYVKVTRKDSLRKLTDEYCDELRAERLNEYKLKLEEEQPAFLEEKIRSLEFIRQEQRECGVEITIKQEEIDETKQKLEEIKEKLRNKEQD